MALVPAVLSLSRRGFKSWIDHSLRTLEDRGGLAENLRCLGDDGPVSP
jgi:hypothetical protein